MLDFIKQLRYNLSAIKQIVINFKENIFMEQNKKKTSSVNTVIIEGYLKENTLENKMVVNKTDQKQREAISGALTIALSHEEDYKIRFMVYKYSASGAENRTYKALEKLLPENTTSIATIMKSNPNATFEAASQIATKVWARGQFELFDRVNDKNEMVSSVTFKGLNAGVKNEASKTPFELKAQFEIDGYFERIQDEKEKGEETGRVIVTLSIPDYFFETCYPIDFICSSDKAIESIRTYERGQSGYFVGTLVNTKKQVVEKRATTKFMDGSEQNNDRTTFSFVNERVIEKMTYPFEEESSDYISPEDIKAFKVNREKKLTELEQKGPSEAPATNNSKNENKKFFI